MPRRIGCKELPGSCSRNEVDDLNLGPDHLRGADKTKSVNRLLRKIENLGFEVTGSGEAGSVTYTYARRRVSS
jgi:hypothetical protein